jgi:hypothetical protein
MTRACGHWILYAGCYWILKCDVKVTEAVVDCEVTEDDKQQAAGGRQQVIAQRTIRRMTV